MFDKMDFLYATFNHLYLGSQQIRFGWQMNKIVKFSILDEKTELAILDEILMEIGQIITKKLSNSFTVIDITIVLFRSNGNRSYLTVVSV